MELNSLTPCWFTVTVGVGRTPPAAETGIQKPNLQVLCLLINLNIQSFTDNTGSI